MEKKWFQSKKFATVIITMLITFGNETFSWGISTDQELSGMLFALAYVLVQAGLEWYSERRKGKKAAPIQLPMIREGIESLINHYYDFNAAREKGIDKYAIEIRDLVIEGLEGLISIELGDNAEVLDEIIRQILKLYNHDTKLKEGADLVRRSVQGSAE